MYHTCLLKSHASEISIQIIRAWSQQEILTIRNATNSINVSNASPFRTEYFWGKVIRIKEYHTGKTDKSQKYQQSTSIQDYDLEEEFNDTVRKTSLAYRNRPETLSRQVRSTTYRKLIFSPLRTTIHSLQ